MAHNVYRGRCKFRISLQALVGIGLIVAQSCVIFAQNGSQNSSLQLTLSQETPGSRFRVELHNTGNKDIVLNLGMMLANGKKQYADRIHLRLTEPDGKVLHLDMTNPVFIAGRIDPMVVPLPKGATLVLPIDLKDYWAPQEKVWSLSLTPGQYALRAEYTGAAVPQRAANLDMQGIALMPYWTGTVESNALSFTVPENGGGQ